MMMGFVTIANAATAPLMHKEATVISVDRMGRSFTTQSNVGSSTFNTTSHTLFQVGAKPTNWGAVKIGDKVGVTYHLNGRNPVADDVLIGG
jgi:hypothetical protein